MSGAGALANATTVGSALVSEAMTSLIVTIICLVAAAVLIILAGRGKSGVALSGLATVVACVGILAGRFVFDALQISVGLYF